ncbi:MAG: hypothetical protein GQ531_03390 [Sulfurovum sp.]|nr:hypothetical protein [Sulfurovum sp.]
MEIKKDEANILKIIYVGYGKLDIFTIFKRAKIPLSKLNTLVKKLETKDYVYIDEYSINITKKAIEWINTREAKEILSNDKNWKMIPNDFLSNKIKINDFYIPNYNAFK